MRKNLSSLDIHYLLKELHILVDGKISKIFHPSKKELILIFHVPSSGKKILKIDAGKSICFVDEKPIAEEPSGFCMYLRKFLINARLREINQKEFERVIEFVFEKEEKYSLILEMFGKGNILFIKDNVILSAVEYHVWKDRAIKPKENYLYPTREYDFLTLTKEKLRDMLKKSSQESLVKSLALDLGLGGTYSEELCILAGVDKKLSPKKVDDIKKLHDTIKILRDKKLSPVIYSDDFAPFELKIFDKKEKQKATDFSSAIYEHFSKQIIPETTEHDKKIEKINKMIQEQQNNIDELKKKEQEQREIGEAIYNNYKLISEILAEINKARQKFSFKEITAKLKGHKIVKQVLEKEKAIILEV